MARPRNVYRGQPRYQRFFSVILIILVAALISVVWLFNYLQKYIVFDASGLHLRPPFLDVEEAEEAREILTIGTPVDAEIVVDEPDFSSVTIYSGNTPGSLRAYYLYKNEISSSAIRGYASTMGNSDQNALVLQLKGSDGLLHYRSALGMAESYVLNGEEDLTKAITELKDNGVYLVAEISTLLDQAMAERNIPLALRDEDGEPLSENDVGTWLDPYNPQVREYLSEMISELSTMGFDEVLLSGIVAPEAETIVYSQAMTGIPDIRSGVSSFAVCLAEAARDADIRCSVLVYPNALRTGESWERGQDLSLFARIFDRLYVRTESYLVQNDLTILSGSTDIGSGPRLVPISTGTISADSYAIQSG